MKIKIPSSVLATFYRNEGFPKNFKVYPSIQGINLQVQLPEPLPYRTKNLPVHATMSCNLD